MIEEFIGGILIGIIVIVVYESCKIILKRFIWNVSDKNIRYLRYSKVHKKPFTSKA